MWVHPWNQRAGLNNDLAVTGVWISTVQKSQLSWRPCLPAGAGARLQPCCSALTRRLTQGPGAHTSTSVYQDGLPKESPEAAHVTFTTVLLAETRPHVPFQLPGRLGMWTVFWGAEGPAETQRSVTTKGGECHRGIIGNLVLSGSSETGESYKT